ncbi:uncharacterized protein PSFLO_06864 [Pseudozyma flocculosa]|uniref:Clathrin light chain n=1 Tax=Pseudozyma flocculosa TaxID=84751 RepID=A0A5C3FAG3_9BASI|nr:uncharacterized protein PSFLO_06864 [Pseudozyma flocculosa]
MAATRPSHARRVQRLATYALEPPTNFYAQAERRNKHKAISKAESDVGNFRAEDGSKKEKIIVKNRMAEAKFRKQRSCDLAEGTTRARVNKTLDLHNSQSKTITHTAPGEIVAGLCNSAKLSKLADPASRPRLPTAPPAFLYYRDSSVPFGPRSAPWVFNILAEAFNQMADMCGRAAKDLSRPALAERIRARHWHRPMGFKEAMAVLTVVEHIIAVNLVLRAGAHLALHCDNEGVRHGLLAGSVRGDAAPVILRLFDLALHRSSSFSCVQATPFPVAHLELAIAGSYRLALPTDEALALRAAFAAL